MILYADMCGGAAGDMIVAALLDCGMPLIHLQNELNKLNLPGLDISTEKVMRKGVTCSKFNVVTPEEHHHRNFNTIKGLIEKSTLSDLVKQTAVKIFRKLAEAEGSIHDMPPEKVRFHEVGAADSIADIVGTAVGMEYFRAEGFYHSEFVLGKGNTKSAHGVIPVPAPATAELLKNFPVKMTVVNSELTTPTGAAIITACSLGSMPESGLSPEKIGYGAGSREPEAIPPYFRLWTIKPKTAKTSDTEIVMEVNIDDMPGEMFPYLMDKLFAAGAKDVFFIPVYMKKRRPAVMVTVTAVEQDVERLSEVFFTHSSTIGIRYYPVKRIKIDREICTVKTPFGDITAKKVVYRGKYRILPEYEDCRNVAEAHNVPLQEVYNCVYQSGIIE